MKNLQRALSRPSPTVEKEARLLSEIDVEVEVEVEVKNEIRMIPHFCTVDHSLNEEEKDEDAYEYHFIPMSSDGSSGRRRYNTINGMRRNGALTLQR